MMKQVMVVLLISLSSWMPASAQTEPQFRSTIYIQPYSKSIKCPPRELKRYFDTLSDKSRFIDYLKKCIPDTHGERVEYYIVTENGEKQIAKYVYFNGDVIMRSQKINFGTRDGKAEFSELQELAEFWRNSVAIIGTLWIDCSMLNGFNKDFVRVVRSKEEYRFEGGLVQGKSKFLLAPGLAHMKAGAFTRLGLVCKGVPEVNFSATLYILTDRDKARVKALTTNIRSVNPEITQTDLLSYLQAYFLLNFGRPSGRNLGEWLIKENLL